MIVLDTNVLIAIFAKHPGMKKRLDAWLEESSLSFSIVSLTELFTGRTASERSEILKYVEDMHLLPFDQREAAILASKYRDKFNLKTPDAIIAASCECGGHQFYTFDRSFLKIGEKWIHVLDY